MSKKLLAASRRDAIGNQPSTAEGQCFYEAYRGPSGKTYGHWILRCLCHPHCETTRGVNSGSINKFGGLELLAYLHVWRDMDVPMGTAHRRCTPKLTDVSRDLSNPSLQSFADLDVVCRG